ncbi:restriction endonuclease subunit S [Enterococcus hirae]
MSNDTQPEIRFPGFTEDWEQRKLGDITESFSGGTPTAGKSEYYGGDIPFIRSGEISSELTELFITENGLNNSSAKMVKAGDILYALYGATSGEVSISRINGAINQAILAIRPTKNDNSYLIVQWLRKQKDTIISTYLQGGQGNLSGSIVKDLVITLPQDKEEQNKIGAFFKQLDDTIALHQRKLDLLKETKKGFLQKMFPKNGAKVPEIRFPGFTEDWEERKLNEGMTEYTDRVYIQDDEIYKQVSVKNVGEITLRGEQIGSKIGRKRQAKVNLIEHPDTLIFTRQTIEQGGIGFAPKETDGAIVTENMPTIDVDNDIINCNYLLAYVKTEDWYRKVILKNIEGGTAQIAIHEDSILSSEVLIPKIEEQQKIGTFFKQIDDTIALHQRKLDLLKETKKGFLQKMFV